LGCETPSGINRDAQVVLSIAAASNTQLAMDSIVEEFTASTGTVCNVSYNSSGMLTAQIEQGAPFDVFASANMEYPGYLQDKGLGEQLKTYGYGHLILVYSKKKDPNSITELLFDASVKRIAIANDATAPYGIAAREWLESSEWQEVLTDKLVIGESIGQVNQYISTNVVEVGITSASYTKTFEKEYTCLPLKGSGYSPIEQGILLLEHGKTTHPKEAKAFIDFLTGLKGQQILTHFGYSHN